jgi:phosphocarrier protein HPr
MYGELVTLKFEFMLKTPINVKSPAVKKNTPTMIKGSFVVMNDKGLHTRPSTELVKCANHFKSQVHLSYQNIVVNAKSLLGILTLAASRGSVIEVRAVGEDAENAVASILQLAKNKFHIQY